jgi:hypothetical protein
MLTVNDSASTNYKEELLPVHDWFYVYNTGERGRLSLNP